MLPEDVDVGYRAEEEEEEKGAEKSGEYSHSFFLFDDDGGWVTSVKGRMQD